MSDFNAKDFASLAKKLLAKYDTGDDYLLGDVAQQIHQAYTKHPEDAVIRQMAFVVEKLAEKHSTAAIVSQAELSALYNDVVGINPNTKFRMVLGHLLMPAPELTKTAAKDLHFDGRAISVNDLVDRDVRKVLETTFDDDLASKAFNKELASKGINYVKAELKSKGLNASSVKVAGGDARHLVYSAAFDTVTGPVSVYVPVSVTDDKFILPATFIDDRGEHALDKDALLASVARRDGVVDPVTGRAKMATDLPELKIERAEMPKELAHLAADFENQVLETTSAFGRETVSMGRKLIANELRAAGFKNAQVSYGSDASDAIIYFASINTPNGKATLEVPLEIKATLDDKYIPMLPTVFAHDEALMDFNASNLQKFALSVSGSHVGANAMYSFMVLPELKEEMIKSANCGDFTACEEVLNHIGATFSADDYRNAIADYQYVLSIKAKAAATQERYAELAQNATLIQAGHGSLAPRQANGQPLAGLVIDEEGNYRKASDIQREKLNPVEDGGAAISSSSIIFS
jgi:hypothetical protein